MTMNKFRREVAAKNPKKSQAHISFVFAFSAILLVLAPPRAQAQTPSLPAPSLTLEDLQKIAQENNPTLAQAAANIRSAEGRKKQSGLYPNPTVGYQGEQIRGGSQRGGEQGFFIQQNIILGGKLGLNRKIFEHEKQQAQAEAEEQKLRVVSNVRMSYVQALAAQETLELRRNLSKLAQDAVETSHQLANVGQADTPDVLESEVEAQQAELAVTIAEQNQERVWKQLAAVVGKPDLPLTKLSGNLEDIPPANTDELLAKILAESPAVKIANLGVSKAEAALLRAKREPIPDLQLRGGLEQNRELSELSGRPIGLQGFADVGVQIPIFNRNQGNVESDKADLERARREVERVRLLLRERAAAVVQSYVTSQNAVQRYKSQMIPRARQAYEMYMRKYHEMAAAYPQVLIAQRTLMQLEVAYITSLGTLATSSITLQSYLLTDGLEAPTQPGEIDRPVREVNMPFQPGSNP